MPLSPFALACALAVHIAPTAPIADTLVDVNGHRLHLEVRRGSAPLTIVLEAGGGADLTSWARVPDSLAQRTDATVVAYDRAGLGRSELGPPELTPRDEIADLRLALGRIAAPRRTILVAHSYGAMLALLHAALHRDDVVGIVLVDPMNPRFVAATGDFLDSTVPDLSDPETDRERALARMIRGFDDLALDVGEVEPGLQVSMVILSAGEPSWDDGEIDAAWRASHEAMAAEVPNRRRILVPRTDHDVPGERPDAIVAAVVRMVEQRDRKGRVPECRVWIRIEKPVNDRAVKPV